LFYSPYQYILECFPGLTSFYKSIIFRNIVFYSCNAMVYYKDDITVYFGKHNSLPHSHFAIEIMIGMNCLLESKIINKHLKPAKAFMVLPNFPHRFSSDREEGEKLIVLIDGGIQIARNIIAKYQLKEKKIIALDYRSIEVLANSIFDQKADKHEKIYNTLVQFVNHLDVIAPKVNLPIPDLDKRILVAIEYVRENIQDQDLDFSILAQKVCLSESRLAHLFKSEMGIPFRKYVLWIRLKAAVAAIKTNHSITQASYIAGFSDSSHFSKVYSEMLGIKPSLPLLDYKS